MRLLRAFPYQYPAFRGVPLRRLRAGRGALDLMTTTGTLPDPTVAGLRPRTRLVAGTLVVAAIAYLALTILFQLGLVDIGTESFAELTQHRDSNWIAYVLTGVAIVVLATSLASAVWRFAPGRGRSWAAAAAIIAILGAALVAVGEGSQAALLYFGPLGGEQFVAAANDDLAHVLGVLLPGNMLWHLSFVAMAIALLRARTVRRWVPWVLLASVVLGFLPAGGPVALYVATEALHAAGPVLVGVALWRRGSVG